MHTVARAATLAVVPYEIGLLCQVEWIHCAVCVRVRRKRVVYVCTVVMRAVFGGMRDRTSCTFSRVGCSCSSTGRVCVPITDDGARTVASYAAAAHVVRYVCAFMCREKRIATRTARFQSVRIGCTLGELLMMPYSQSHLGGSVKNCSKMPVPDVYGPSAMDCVLGSSCLRLNYSHIGFEIYALPSTA